MPPALRCPNSIPSLRCTRHLRSAAPRSSRPFSATAHNDARQSRARRGFFRWLATHGQAFRNPLPGSTNYLNAYDRDGQLKRVVEARKTTEEVTAKEEAAKAAGQKYERPERRENSRLTEPLGPPSLDGKASAPVAKKTPPLYPLLRKESGSRNEPAKLKDASGVVYVCEDDGKYTKTEETVSAVSKEQRGEGVIHNLKPPRLQRAAASTLPAERSSDLRPFPANQEFSSQPVLSDRFKTKLWQEIMLNGKSVSEVSAEYRVEMSRVGAVVRLLEVEKEWNRIGKPCAIPYAEAVMGMLPKTPYIEEEHEAGRFKPHESINDLPVHRATGQQIFLPTSESRHFTREDAAKAFDERLLPADLRIPHPELVVLHKEQIEGLSDEERAKLAKERADLSDKKRAAKMKDAARKEVAVKKVDTGRWEYRFTEISVEAAGKDGRGHKGTGWRYGAPLMDRSRGSVKIPTSVQ